MYQSERNLRYILAWYSGKIGKIAWAAGWLGISLALKFQGD